MSKKEIKEQYRMQIEKAGSHFEKQMLQAERDHKLKMLDLNVDEEKSREDSHFVCVGCSG
jgi:hypothetical protein